MSESYLSSLFSLKGKCAVVTGAARGNGAAMAEALLRAGAKVLLVDVLEAELMLTLHRLQQHQLDAKALCIDLTTERASEDIVNAVLAEFGSCHILVNNAGISLSADPLSYPESSWDLTYLVNLKAPFLLTQQLAKIMTGSGGGSIINVTSLNSELAFPGNPAYVAFKGALKQLTKSLALDLGHLGIRANAIGPGYIHTDMTKKSYANPELNQQRCNRTALGRWGTPSDLAGAVIFLASDASSYITGIDLYVDGGWLIKGL